MSLPADHASGPLLIIFLYAVIATIAALSVQYFGEG